MSTSPVARPAVAGYSADARSLVLSYWKHRALVRGLVVREIVGRYRGSFFGVAWSLIQPLVMLSVYTFVFGQIFQSRWGGTGGTSEFALALFAGLIVFNFFAECVTRSTSQILANPNFVKKVVFPLEIFPWVVVGSALFHLAIGTVVWIAFWIVLHGPPQATIVLFPVVLVPLLLLSLGLSWFLCSLGVYVRDINQLIGLVTSALMFLSPVFYDVSAVPERLRWIFRINPLTFVIEQSRRALMTGGVPDLEGLAAQVVLGAVIAWLGFAWFQRTRQGFGDVL